MRVRLAVAFLVLVAASVGGGVASANGADQVRGAGIRSDGLSFEFFAIVTPSGNAVGRVSLPELDLTAKITCGAVQPDGTAIIGGTGQTGYPFSISMRDGPDGFIFGSKATPCDTTGFGEPGSLSLASGYIEVVDR